jgi:alanyl-tRNA synthetase
MLTAPTPKTLRDTLDKLKDKLKSAAIVLASVDADKVQLAAASRTTASHGEGRRARQLRRAAGRRQGWRQGRPGDGGGTDPSKLAAALASVEGWVADASEASGACQTWLAARILTPP